MLPSLLCPGYSTAITQVRIEVYHMEQTPQTLPQKQKNNGCACLSVYLLLSLTVLHDPLHNQPQQQQNPRHTPYTPSMGGAHSTKFRNWVNYSSILYCYPTKQFNWISYSFSASYTYSLKGIDDDDYNFTWINYYIIHGINCHHWAKPWWGHRITLILYCVCPWSSWLFHIPRSHDDRTLESPKKYDTQIF